MDNTPKTPTVPGASTPHTSSPRPGHKYIKRDWVKDHWEYTYADQAHPTSHGHQALASGAESHTLDVPESHAGADPKEAYLAARKQTYAKPGKHRGVFPGTNEPVDYHVHLDKKGNPTITVHKPTEDEKVGELAHNQKFKNWAQIEAWHRRHPNTVEIKDEQGNLQYTIQPNVGTASAEDEYIPRKPEVNNVVGNTYIKNDGTAYTRKTPLNVDRQAYRLKFHEGSPGYGMYAGNQLVKPSKEKAQAHIDKLKRHSKVAQESANRPPASTYLAPNESALSALEQNKLPYTQDKKGLKPSFSSEDERDQFVNKVISEMPVFNELANKDIGTLSNAVNYAIDHYNSDVGKFENYVKLLLGFKNKNPSIFGFNTVPESKLTSSAEGEGGGDRGSTAMSTEATQEDALDEPVDLGSMTQNLSSSLEDWADQDDSFAVFLPKIIQGLEQVEDQDDLDRFMSVLQNGVSQLYGDNPKKLEQFRNQVLSTLEDTQKALYLSKAIKIITANELCKNLNYSHKEGLEFNPRFYYKDNKNNYAQLTNAPMGHEDYKEYLQPPVVAPSEVNQNTNPEYFDQQGRKLLKQNPNNAIWNNQYSNQDPNNMWSSQWSDPQGNLHYNYYDSDVRDNDAFNNFRNLLEVDASLDFLREYTSTLFSSGQIKDQVVALALIFIDQGHFEIDFINEIKVGSLQFQGNLLVVDNNKKLLLTPEMQTALTLLSQGKSPEDSLFSFPVGNQLRVVRKNLIYQILDNIGIDGNYLERYHATQSYSAAMSKILSDEDIDFEAANFKALLTVCEELGFNIESDEDIVGTLVAFQEAYIDKVVANVIKTHAIQMGLGQGAPNFNKPFYPKIPVLDIELRTRTEEEKAFSKYIHLLPAHLYLPNQVEDIYDDQFQEADLNNE